MRSSTVSGIRRSRGMVAAVMLGTAMSAFGAPATGAVTDLSRYCTACWRNAHLPVDCWSDCTQDVFVRLLERVPEADWPRALQSDGDERRELVRAIDTVRKRVQRARRFVSGDGIESAAAPTPESSDRRETVERAALNLSQRQQSIIADTMLGYSVPEIAVRLGMTAERVSDEKYKAIRKLQSAVRTEA